MGNEDLYDWTRFAGEPGFIADLPHSVAYLLPDQTYRGRTVVWLKEHFDDPADLPVGLLNGLMSEVMLTAEALRRELRPDRLNYTCFGNVVPHVHWHIIPRVEGDTDWGGAPWRENEVTLADADARALAAGIAAHLEMLRTDD